MKKSGTSLGEEEEGQQHCTAACRCASNSKCVCGCGGKNHGIMTIVKMDAFFPDDEEEKELQQAIRDEVNYAYESQSGVEFWRP